MGKLIFLGLTAFLTCVDIGIKSCAENSIKRGEEHEFADGKILVRKVYNKGMALNTLEDQPEVVKQVATGSAILLTIYQLFALFQKGQFIKKLGLSLMVAGAWGNVFDRWVRGYVIDYISFKTKWEKLTNVTFNLADGLIFDGSILVMLAAFLPGNRKGKGE